MRRIFFLIVSLTSSFLWISCAKQNMESIDKPREFPKVSIDSLLLLDFNDILIAASYENAGTDSIIKKGFCWSTAQNPDINDPKSDVAPSAPFSDTIYDVGLKATIYFRAFVQTADSIYYSENGTIVTGGLDNTLISDLNDGRVRHIWQVIETPDNNFLQLIIVVGAGVVWPQVVKLDRAGNVLWKQDFYPGERKYPDEIMKVADGYMFVSTDFANLVRGISLTKIDFNGGKAWEKTFAQKANQELIRMTSLPGNQVKLTMISYDDFVANGRINCSIDEFIVDLSGNPVSEKTVLVDNSITLKGDVWLAANVTGEGFFMTSHYTDPGSLIFDELAVQKYDSALHLEWEKLYKKANVNGPASVSLSPAGDYNILALIEQSGKQNAWLMEIDKSNGNKKWEFIYGTNKYGSPVSSFGKKLYLDPSGNYYVFGRVTDPAYPGESLFVLKLTHNGKKLWNHVFKIPKGQYADPEAILKKGNEIFLFGAIGDQQVVGSNNSLYMTILTEN